METILANLTQQVSQLINSLVSQLSSLVGSIGGREEDTSSDIVVSIIAVSTINVPVLSS